MLAMYFTLGAVTLLGLDPSGYSRRLPMMLLFGVFTYEVFLEYLEELPI